MEKIRERLVRGYTMAVYGTREKIHEQMSEDIESLLIFNEALKAQLPPYKEVKEQCEKQLNALNQFYAEGTMGKYENRFFKAGFLRSYLFIKKYNR